MIPIIIGMNLSVLFEMSVSVPRRFAQNNIITIGRIDAKIKDITSSTINSPIFSLIHKHIIKNKGIQIIGGLVSVEIILAILNLSIYIIILKLLNKYFESKSMLHCQ